SPCKFFRHNLTRSAWSRVAGSRNATSNRFQYRPPIVARLNNSFSRPNFAVPMSEIGTVPDQRGHFGPYGGMFVPETLMSALHDLAAEYERAKTDRQFQNELSILLRDFAGRPTPLYLAERLTNKLAGPKIYLKREDLLHTGAH